MDFILNYLPEIASGILLLLTSVFGVKFNKYKKIGKILFDAIQDNKISEEEAKKISDAFRELYKKKTS